MNKSDIKKKIEEILNNLLDCETEKKTITEKTIIFKSTGESELGLSSLDFIEFLVVVEEEFGIIYDFNTKVETVEELITYIYINKTKCE